MGKEKSKKKPDGDPPQEQEDNEQRSGIWQDERFQYLVTDPRFKNLPKSQRKVKIDKRFQSMFTDKKFNVKYTVDKYGRRVNQSTAENLKKYYELNSSASEEEEGDDDEAKDSSEQQEEAKAITRDSDEERITGEAEEPEENDELVKSADEEDEDKVRKSLREKFLDPDIDYARGEGRLVTDSSSGEESTDDDENDPELQIDHVWGELANDAETTDESTPRLAVCNMDWDRIRATDLMVLFSSFLPPGGSVLSVKIYPSEFGKERMEADEKYGPTELIEQALNKIDTSKKNKKKSGNDSNSDSEDELVQEQDSDAEEGDEYHMEKLRQYQLNRLRYYYAVVVCDSVKTADKIYQECDGIEYESSATKVDLRFIPEDTTFDDEPRDTCTELPDSNSYKPRQFTTTALQQAKVDLTWDETSVERQELGDKLLTGKFDDVSDADLRKIIAYSSEEDDEDDDQEDVPAKSTEEKPLDEKSAEKKPKKNKDDAIAKYKALLAEINEQEKIEKNHKYGMEVSWTVDKAKSDEDQNDQESDVSTEQQHLTPIEKELQKRSEKNKKRKEERKKKKKQAMGLNTDDSDTDEDSLPDDIDLNDPYFAEEFANGDFVESKTKSKSKVKSQKHKKNYKEADETETKNEQELQLLLDDGDLVEENKQHFSLEKILKAETETKSKRKRKQQLKKSKSAIAADRKEIQDNFEVNLNDDRFKAVYQSHLYNIDPTDSHFKKTKGMEQIINEKLKRRHGDNNQNRNEDDPADEQLETKRPKKQLENNLLVKSLKRKIQMKQQS